MPVETDRLIDSGFKLSTKSNRFWPDLTTIKNRLLLTFLLAATILPIAPAKADEPLTPQGASTPAQPNSDLTSKTTATENDASSQLQKTWEVIFSSGRVETADTGTNILYNSKLIANLNTDGKPFRINPTIVIDSSGKEPLSSGGGVFVENCLNEGDGRFARAGFYLGLRRGSAQGWLVNQQLGANPIKDTRDVTQISGDTNLNKSLEINMDPNGINGTVGETGSSDEARKPLNFERSITDNGKICVSVFSTKGEKTTITDLTVSTLSGMPPTQ